jgi:PhnB protein
MFDTKRHRLLPALLKGDSSMTANFIPEGYHTVTPYLFVPNAAEMIEFLKQAFDATELERFTQPDGSVGHGEVRIGDSVVMVSQAHGEWKAMPTSLYLYVSDAEARYKRAIELGATSLMEPGIRSYGNLEAGVKDQMGNIWWIATRKEELSVDEMKQRFEANAQQQSTSEAEPDL